MLKIYFYEPWNGLTLPILGVDTANSNGQFMLYTRFATVIFGTPNHLAQSERLFV
jgi:hypothetical protein